jgi:hypothetical protein
MDLNERSCKFVFECLVSLTLFNGMPLPAVCAAIFVNYMKKKKRIKCKCEYGLGLLLQLSDISSRVFSVVVVVVLVYQLPLY